jgi:gamma-D-glutamyl-L-lysine dipeptidyl-peptidase
VFRKGGILMRTGYILVSVATLWTSSQHPREIDLPAISQAVDIPLWLDQMSRWDRIWLIRQNAVQTQALFGTRIHILEEKAGWSYCVIPDQFTPKSNAGYPGWIPLKQIGFNKVFHEKSDTSPSVWVTSPKAELTTSVETKTISYLTRLPFQKQTNDKVYVYLPTGDIGWFKNSDVTISFKLGRSPLLSTPYPMLPKRNGAQIAKMGELFLGVPYLWSGMSSFAYDCSGFSHSLYKAAGILIPRDASVQFEYGKERGLEIPRALLQTGDLVYFRNEAGRIDHVGIFSGENELLHASNSNFCVKKEPLWESKYAERYSGAIRFWS